MSMESVSYCLSVIFHFVGLSQKIFDFGEATKALNFIFHLMLFICHQLYNNFIHPFVPNNID